MQKTLTWSLTGALQLSPKRNWKRERKTGRRKRAQSDGRFRRFPCGWKGERTGFTSFNSSSLGASCWVYRLRRLLSLPVDKGLPGKKKTDQIAKLFISFFFEYFSFWIFPYSSPSPVGRGCVQTALSSAAPGEWGVLGITGKSAPLWTGVRQALRSMLPSLGIGFWTGSASPLAGAHLLTVAHPWLPLLGWRPRRLHAGLGLTWRVQPWCPAAQKVSVYFSGTDFRPGPRGTLSRRQNPFKQCFG